MQQNLTELQGETDKSTIIVRYFNAPFSIINTNRQIINQEGYIRFRATY